MRSSSAIILISLLTLAAANNGFGEIAPAYTIIEAESQPRGEVKKDAAALSGMYVQQTGAYQPMLITTLPAAGDSWVIWARIKDVNFQLKAVRSDGTQKDLNWQWEQPAEWTWVSFGRHSRSELGASILLMRGPKSGPRPGLDAALFARDDAFNPETALPKPRPVPVTVITDWNRIVAHAAPISYGLNAFGGFDPSNTQNASYQNNLAFMGAGLLRLHNMGMLNDSRRDPNGWVDTANRRWDAAKINKALRGAFPYGPALMIDIPGWPDWMKGKDGFLDSGEVGAFAQFCAQLVLIVNKELGQQVRYWEVTNEKDGLYYGDFHNNSGPLKDPARPDRVLDLAAIYNQCAVTMKAVDPKIMVGGPAIANAYQPDLVRRFVAATAPNLDFFSYHIYVSGSKDDPDSQIFERARSLGGVTKQISDIVAASAPHHRILAFLDEYNISWTWETRDSRMTNAKGAVFDALSMTSAIMNSADATMAWNEKDGIYGKMDNDFHLRPGARVFYLFNHYLVGDVMFSNSTDPDAITAYAVWNAVERRKSVLLINSSTHQQKVILQSGGAEPVAAASWTRYQVMDAGYEETKVEKVYGLSNAITVPADSVLLFTAALRNK